MQAPGCAARPSAGKAPRGRGEMATRESLLGSSVAGFQDSTICRLYYSFIFFNISIYILRLLDFWPNGGLEKHKTGLTLGLNAVAQCP